MQLRRAGLALAMLLSATTARAGGFELPDTGASAVGRGGAFTVKADDLTALAINPGGLSRLRGTRFLYNHNLIWAPVTFTRTPSVIPGTPDFTDPFTPVHNQDELFPLGAMGVLASDFGLEDWTFAIGVYGPNAVGKQSFPVNGGSRYMLTSTDILLVYYSLAVAYGHKDVFGVGVTLQYVDMPVTKFSLVVDAEKTLSNNAPPLSPYDNRFDVEATLDLKDRGPTFTALLGAWWRIIPELEVAVSGRIVPIYLRPEGDIRLANVPDHEPLGEDILVIEDQHAEMPITLPLTARAGLRYRYLDGEAEVFDVELNAVYESWSMLERYDVKLSGRAVINELKPLEDIAIEKRWRDTVSVRLGGSWEAVQDWFGISAGAYWERGAVPQNYTHLDFLSLDRWGVGGGLRFKHWGVDLAISYNHVFQADVTVAEEDAKVFQQRPLFPCPGAAPCKGGQGVPANAGTFESSFDILAMSLQLHFDEWF